jgi:hypothetical protein
MSGRSRRQRRLGGAIETISFGGFLIIVGYIWASYPSIFSELWRTFIRLVEDQVLQPSRIVVIAAYTYLFLLGLQDAILGGLRAATGQRARRVVKELYAAVAYAGLGYLVLQFSRGEITSSLLILYVFLTAGVLVILYGATAYLMER